MLQRRVALAEFEPGLRVLTMRGVERRDALRAAGLGGITCTFGHVPMSCLTDFWVFVGREFGAVAACAIGDAHEFRDYGLAGRLVLCASDLREGVVIAVWSIRDHADIDWHFVEGDRSWMIVLRRPHHALAEAQVYADISAVVEWLRVVRGQTREAGIQPLEVRFAHSRPPRGADEIARVIDAPVRWEHGPTAILFDRDLLAVRNPSADPAQMLALRAVAHASVAQRERVADRVVREVEQRLGRANPGRETLEIRSVAKTLGTSPRSLERALQSEASPTAEALRDEVLRDGALVALADGASVEEVAERLGYNDAAAFCRAFKRWTERTPSAYRLRAA